MGEEPRVRLMWPDEVVPPIERARQMALAYREEALEALAQLDTARKALASVDLRVLKFADPQAAKAVRDLVKNTPADPVTALDNQFSEWGESWHADPPEFVFDDDDWVPTMVATQIVGMNNNTLGDRRSRGEITSRYVRRGPGKTFLYRVGELRELRARLAKATTSGRWTAKYQ